ncbi:MAG: hypothetical protein MUF54_25250, partial [Polyangiaceae bacterium]|nr:hypothetical protein [Polyangiaceae bacterium]
GSGRTVLVRRAAWTLGVEGRDVAWVEEEGMLPWAEAIAMELQTCPTLEGAVVLIDGADQIPVEGRQLLGSARQAGAKLVVVSSAEEAAVLGGTVERYAMPRLDDALAAGLVRRAIPSLSDSLVEHVIRRGDGRPGRLRHIVRRIGSHAVVSTHEIDQILSEGTTVRAPGGAVSGIGAIDMLLDQGKQKHSTGCFALQVSNSLPTD